jgi:hypothetical protein
MRERAKTFLDGFAIPRALPTLVALALLGGAMPSAAADSQQQITFPTPQAAMKALLEASANNDTQALRQIFGPGTDDLITSGDEVADKNERAAMAAAAQKKAAVVRASETRMEVQLGLAGWPYPVPIVKDGKAWRFDSATGMEELINRRIGNNELDAIAFCRAYADAQEAFATMRKTRIFASKWASDEGQHDGLYWENKDGEPLSPFGDIADFAIREGYGKSPESAPKPFHGYYFRALQAQGPDAPGGEKSYIDKDGKQSGGYALLAWPANYGTSGIMTFIINAQDIVFQKDFGERTGEAVKAITAYDPDESWSPVVDEDEAE